MARRSCVRHPATLRDLTQSAAIVGCGPKPADHGAVRECPILLKAAVHFVRAFPTPTLSKKSYNQYDRSEARSALGFIEEV